MNDFKEWLRELAEELVKFTEAIQEAFATVGEAFEKLRGEIREACAEIFDIRSDRKGWREAALLAGQRAAARAKAFGLQATFEKARRAMRRRKRLHADGGLPDW